MPAHSFFFYLQLRSSLQAHGAPVQQALPIHPLYKLLTTRSKNRGMVFVLYYFFLEACYLELPLDRIWRSDCPSLASDFIWSQVWMQIKEASQNPDHQQIHFNYIHRTYLTPRKLHCRLMLPEGSWYLFTYDVGLPFQYQ